MKCIYLASWSCISVSNALLSLDVAHFVSTPAWRHTGNSLLQSKLSKRNTYKWNLRLFGTHPIYQNNPIKPNLTESHHSRHCKTLDHCILCLFKYLRTSNAPEDLVLLNSISNPPPLIVEHVWCQPFSNWNISISGLTPFDEMGRLRPLWLFKNCVIVNCLYCLPANPLFSQIEFRKSDNCYIRFLIISAINDSFLSGMRTCKWKTA